MGIYKGNPRWMARIFECSITNLLIPAGKKGRDILFTMSPTTLSDSISANYNQTPIPGASSPVVTFSNTGARQVNISFEVTIDYLPPGYNDTEEYLNAFRALVYPDFNGNIVKTPNCILNMPNLTIDGCCASCNIEYKTERYGQDGAMGASVSLSILEVMDKPYGSVYIASQKTPLSGKGTFMEERDGILYESNSSQAGDTNVNLTIRGSKIVNTSWGDFDKNGKKAPDYTDEKVICDNSEYSIVTFYASSAVDYEIHHSMIYYDSGTGYYYIAVHGSSNLVMTRNAVPKKKSIIADTYYYYYIYVPYHKETYYLWEKAVIRKVIVKKGEDD